ncbi:VIT family-domain-containing protein [Diplogelasinospora grovesii]|uniref:VIT family-domain-containing protein n=1 Tax=Diplogelasinospora grovesii TaxID=303347 RepID=A0AAN6N9D6_9PEZI|nr:VIT family-domain-containing protein [Diplogelasinospora grovesii]
MSLVGLKKLLFGQANTTTKPLRFQTRDAEKKAKSLDRESAGESSDKTVTEGDLEAQQDSTTLAATTEAETDGREKKGGFQINARVISDATIGLSDGLTVPFALTAGLSALGDTKVVIYGGLAELIAGAISMGLGGYLGAKSEMASYKETKMRTETLVSTNPQETALDIRAVFEPFELPPSTLDSLTSHLSTSPKLVDFLMQFQHCQEEPASSRAFTSALTIALGYFLGGLLPLIPYFCVGEADLLTALYISIGVMAVALFSFGYGKTCVVTGWKGSRCVKLALWGGVQMVIIGGAAAGAAMGLVKAFNHYTPS